MLDLLNTVNDGIVAGMDLMLGWMLALPTDLTLVLVAVLTAALLTFVRLFTTDQDLLNRCAADKKRLKALIREAKGRRDKDAVGRHRATIGLIGVQTMKAEFKPLVVSLIPIVCVASWAFARLGFVPPTGDEPIAVRAYFPTVAIGELAHVAPPEGLDAPGGWIRRVVEEDAGDGPVTCGVACWTFQAERRDAPYELEFRCGGETVSHRLIVDGRRYGPPLMTHEGGVIVATELVGRPYRFLGVVPGFEQAALPPWVVGYLLAALPATVGLKRIFRIA